VRRTTEIKLALVVSASLVACGNNGGAADASTDPPCVSVPDAGCAASYDPPTFDAIFKNIFQPNCAVGTGTCHTADFVAGGISFADETTAYDLLLGAGGGASGTAYVLPKDPSCSTLMKRLESTDPNYHMPRGNNFLMESDLCTITQWIDEGAQR
jgi:hypothetical protein